MKNLLFMAIAVSAMSLPMVHATTVGFSPAPTARTVRNASDTTTLATTSLVWAGNFTNGSGSFSLNSALSLGANVTAVETAGGWKQFSLDSSTGLVNAGVTGTVGISPIGKVSGSVTDNNAGATKADFFNGKDVYLWIFNAPTVAGATEMGIFRATSADVPWTFPTNANGLGDTVTFSTIPANATIAAIGGFGSTPVGQLNLSNNFNVAPVPEPSTMAFGLLTAGAAIYSRRRR